MLKDTSNKFQFNCCVRYSIEGTMKIIERGRDKERQTDMAVFEKGKQNDREGDRKKRQREKKEKRKGERENS